MELLNDRDILLSTQSSDLRNSLSHLSSSPPTPARHAHLSFSHRRAKPTKLAANSKRHTAHSRPPASSAAQDGLPLSHAQTHAGGTTRRRSPRSSSADLAPATVASQLFTPGDRTASPPSLSVHYAHQESTNRAPRKSVSSPVLQALSVALMPNTSAHPTSASTSPTPLPSPPPYSASLPPPLMPSPGLAHPISFSQQNSDSEDGQDDGMIYASRTQSGSGSRFALAGNRTPPLGSAHPHPHLHPHQHPPLAVYPGTRKSKLTSNTSLRHRLFAEREWEREPKAICTTPGMVCAGETETETDEPSRHLPTARISRTSSSLSHSLSFSPTSSSLPWERLLCEFSRLLAIVPASLGFIWCLWHVYIYVPDPSRRITNPGRPPPDRIDYIIASFWALLTAHQCLSLTTGLLTRWKHYYTPLSTLVRLLALQGICWPATHLTVNILEAAKRPAAVWAVIGTTTCMSRSVQIWVVSNLPANSTSSSGLGGGISDRERERELRRSMEADGGATREHGYWRKWNKWRRRRRWDWREVSIKCVLPAGILYFVMAWTWEIRRELGGC